MHPTIQPGAQRDRDVTVGYITPLWLMLAGASWFVSAGIALLSSGRW
jgi:hypothetical protein